MAEKAEKVKIIYVKKCRYCKEKIPAKAKKCPYCNKQLGLSDLRVALIVVVAIVIVGSFINGTTTARKEPMPRPITTHTSVNKDADHVELTVEGQKIKERYPSWSNRACNAISQRKVFVGMTKQQVFASWGVPDKLIEWQGARGFASTYNLRNASERKVQGLLLDPIHQHTEWDYGMDGDVLDITERSR